MIIFLLIHLAYCDWYHNAKAVSITGSNYDSLIGADKFVVLDFFTPWCIYCQQMLGEYNRVYDYYQENRPDIIIAKINCDEQQNQVVCRSLGVGSFPTILFFNPESKQPISQFQNYRRYDLFVNWIDQLAKKSQQQIEKEEQLKAEKQRLQELARIEEEERRRQFEMQEQLKMDMDKQIDSHKFEIKSYEDQFKELQSTIDQLQSKVAQLNTQLGLLRKKPKININQVLVFGIFGFLIGVTLTSCICLSQRKYHHN